MLADKKKEKWLNKDKLSKLMKERGINQAEMSKFVGCSPGAFSLYMSGDRDPNKMTVRQMAKKLDVNWHELID